MSSGRRDKRNIAKKKRTPSCATGLRNLWASARRSLSPRCAGSSNRGKHGRDGGNGVRNDGKLDVRMDGKNGREDDAWVFDVDSDSDDEGPCLLDCTIDDGGDGKIAGDCVEGSNCGENVQDGKNGVLCNDGKNDVRYNQKKNGKEDDAWVFDVDSDSDNEGDSGGYDGACLPNRPARKFLPSQRQAMLLLSMAVPPEDRACFKERFHAFANGKETSLFPMTAGHDGKVCNTEAAWIAAAYGCDFVHQLQCAADMFPPFSRMESCFLSEIYIMDVILNRSPLMESEPSAKLPTKQAAPSAARGEDDVLLVRSYHEDDLDDRNDFKFRTMIVFLPQCGVFYCARERRKEDVGVAKTHVALDMSWLRLERSTDDNGKVTYTFGKGGYVKRFHMEGTKHFRYQYPKRSDMRFEKVVDRVSAWRLSLNRTSDLQQNRVVYRVEQCLDSDGPRMAPDVFDGSWQPNIPREYLALEYNQRLAVANSVRMEGRHYAPGCHHYRLPDTCWIIDPTSEHFVDIMVDLPPLGLQRNRQSVIMVRNVNFLTDDGGGDL